MPTIGSDLCLAAAGQPPGIRHGPSLLPAFTTSHLPTRCLDGEVTYWHEGVLIALYSARAEPTKESGDADRRDAHLRRNST